MSSPPRPTPLTDLVAQTIDATGDLLDAHVALAKAEVSRDLRRAGRAGGILLMSATFVGLGAVSLHVAVAVALMPWLGVAGAFGALGALDVALGGATLAFGSSHLRSSAEAPTWGAELSQSARTILQRRPHGEAIDVE